MRSWESWRLVAVLATVAAFAVFAVGCGSDDSEEQQAAISTVIADAIMQEDAQQLCTELIAPDYVETIYGDTETCIDAEERNSESPDEVIVSDIEIDGDVATASVEEVGGESDGTSGTVTVSRDGDLWQISELGIDYLRSALEQGFANTEFGAEDAPLDDADFRECFSDGLQDLDDDTFRNMAYESMALEDPNEDFMGAFTECARETGVADENGNGNGAENVSVIREQFEQGIRESLEADDLGQGEVDCVLGELRDTVSDDEIVEQVSAGADDIQPDLAAAVARAMANC